MRFIILFMLISFTGVTHSFGQSDSKKKDKKEQNEKNKSKSKADEKLKKSDSIGELAEEAGKRIWKNVKGLFNVVVEDVIDKKKRIIPEKKEEEKDKEKQENLKKNKPNEKASKQKKKEGR